MNSNIVSPITANALYNKSKANDMINRKWWLKMAKEANHRWNNYAWQMYYMDIEEYCRQRASESTN